MIIEGAIGDAYGAGFEFAPKNKIISCNDVTKYYKHPIYNEIEARYTDDTQMSIALAELILSGKEWNQINIADSFLTTFKRDPRRGYSKRFYAFLSKVKNGQEFLSNINNKSNRNGATMRSYVLGVYANIDEVIEKCTIQAEVTHQSESAVRSAISIALISHYFINELGEKDHLVEFLNDIQNYSWKGDWKDEVGMIGDDTVEATLTMLMSELSLKMRLQKSIDFGGDVDTVASLVMALSSLDDAVDLGLPRFLINDLENGDYGKSYISNLDNKIIAFHKGQMK